MKMEKQTFKCVCFLFIFTTKAIEDIGYSYLPGECELTEQTFSAPDPNVFITSTSSFAEAAFTPDGWKPQSGQAETLTVRVLSDGPATLMEVRFELVGAAGTKLRIMLETTEGKTYVEVVYTFTESA